MGSFASLLGWSGQRRSSCRVRVSIGSPLCAIFVSSAIQSGCSFCRDSKLKSAGNRPTSTWRFRPRRHKQRRPRFNTGCRKGRPNRNTLRSRYVHAHFEHAFSLKNKLYLKNMVVGGGLVTTISWRVQTTSRRYSMTSLSFDRPANRRPRNSRPSPSPGTTVRSRSRPSRRPRTGLPRPFHNRPAAARRAALSGTRRDRPARPSSTRRTSSSEVRAAGAEHADFGVPTAVGHQSVVAGANVQAENVVGMVLVALARFRRLAVIPYPIVHDIM